VRAVALLLLCTLLPACGANYAGDVIPNTNLSEPRWEQALPTGAGPSAIALLDLNDDQRTDVAVANTVDGTVSLYLHVKGRLEAGPVYAVGRGPSALAAVHLDDDNRLDLVVANAADSTLSTLLSKGQPLGTLTAGPLHATDENPSTLAIGDVTGDDSSDIVVGCAGSDSIVVLENPRKGGMLTQIGKLQGLPSLRAVALLPLDASQPQRLDLAVARADSEDLSLFAGDGRGGFASRPLPLRLPTGSTPVALVADNLDGDSQGRVDLAVLDHSVGQLVLAQAVGTMQFRISSQAVGEKPAALAVGQLDADARPELAVTDPSSERVALLLGGNNTALSPLPLSYYATPGLPAAVAITDVDADGLGDVLVLCRADGLLRVLSPSGVWP
jgi:hypothetical protein